MQRCLSFFMQGFLYQNRRSPFLILILRYQIQPDFSRILQYMNRMTFIFTISLSTTVSRPPLLSPLLTSLSCKNNPSHFKSFIISYSWHGIYFLHFIYAYYLNSFAPSLLLHNFQSFILGERMLVNLSVANS